MKYIICRTTYEYITVEAETEDEALDKAVEADGWDWSYTPGDEEYEVVGKR